MALRAERHAPLVLGVVGAVASFMCSALWLLGARWRATILESSIAVGAIFAAYLATALTILPAVDEKPIVARLRQAGLFGGLVGYIGSAIYWMIGVVVLSIALIPIGEVRWLDRWVSALWWGALTCAVAAMVRAVRMTIRLVLAHPGR